jgi:hypothetical protein
MNGIMKGKKNECGDKCNKNKKERKKRYHWNQTL